MTPATIAILTTLGSAAAVALAAYLSRDRGVFLPAGESRPRPPHGYAASDPHHPAAYDEPRRGVHVPQPLALLDPPPCPPRTWPPLGDVPPAEEGRCHGCPPDYGALRTVWPAVDGYRYCVVCLPPGYVWEDFHTLPPAGPDGHRYGALHTPTGAPVCVRCGARQDDPRRCDPDPGYYRWARRVQEWQEASS